MWCTGLATTTHGRSSKKRLKNGSLKRASSGASLPTSAWIPRARISSLQSGTTGRGRVPSTTTMKMRWRHLRSTSLHEQKANTNLSRAHRNQTEIFPIEPPRRLTQSLTQPHRRCTKSGRKKQAQCSHRRPLPPAARKFKTPRKLQVRSLSSSQTPQIIPSASPMPNALLTSFPYLPSTITTCVLTACTVLKSEPESIKACQHDVERLLRASGLYSYEWLRQERLRWHPDRFGRLCDEAWREAGKKMAGEMFKLLGVLIEEIASQERREKRRSGV